MEWCLQEGKDRFKERVRTSDAGEYDDRNNIELLQTAKDAKRGD